MLEIHNDTHFKQLLGQAAPFIVWFSASWCGPCRSINKPELAAFAASHGVPLYYCDADAHHDIMSACRITQVPTFLVFKDGKPGSQRVKGADMNAIHALIKSVRQSRE